jgi:glyoxylase-like metal-dependent hydrolase (beta-lactamase superfamily II)
MKFGMLGRLFALATSVLVAATAHAAEPKPMVGKVVVSSHGDVRLHTYVAPPMGWLVDTQIVEGPNGLVIFDAQLLNLCAEEVATYAASLGKPIERIVVSHGHPDHWAGLDVLKRRFPNAPVYALPAVASQIQQQGPVMLKRLGQMMGDAIAKETVSPTGVLTTGPQKIAGIEFEFREIKDAESDLQLLALMPRQKVMLAFDLVFAPHDHVFTMAPHFAHWVELLESLRAMSGYDTILIGHDAPTDRTGFDATINYLRKASELYAASPDGRAYAEGLKAAFPQRQQQSWIDFAGGVLFASKPRP